MWVLAPLIPRKNFNSFWFLDYLKMSRSFKPRLTSPQKLVHRRVYHCQWQCRLVKNVEVFFFFFCALFPFPLYLGKIIFVWGSTQHSAKTNVPLRLNYVLRAFNYWIRISYVLMKGVEHVFLWFTYWDRSTLVVGVKQHFQTSHRTYHHLRILLWYLQREVEEKIIVKILSLFCFFEWTCYICALVFWHWGFLWSPELKWT